MDSLTCIRLEIRTSTRKAQRKHPPQLGIPTLGVTQSGVVLSTTSPSDFRERGQINMAAHLKRSSTLCCTHTHTHTGICFSSTNNQKYSLVKSVALTIKFSVWRRKIHRVSEKSGTNGNILSRYVPICRTCKNQVQRMRKDAERTGETCRGYVVNNGYQI